MQSRMALQKSPSLHPPVFLRLLCNPHPPLLVPSAPAEATSETLSRPKPCPQRSTDPSVWVLSLVAPPCAPTHAVQRGLHAPAMPLCSTSPQRGPNLSPCVCPAPIQGATVSVSCRENSVFTGDAATLAKSLSLCINCTDHEGKKRF